MCRTKVMEKNETHFTTNTHFSQSRAVLSHSSRIVGLILIAYYVGVPCLTAPLFISENQKLTYTNWESKGSDLKNESDCLHYRLTYSSYALLLKSLALKAYPDKVFLVFLSPLGQIASIVTTLTSYLLTFHKSQFIPRFIIYVAEKMPRINHLLILYL